MLAVALVTVSSTGVAGARVAGDDLSRVSKSGDELAKAGGAKFRGTTSSGGGGKGSTVTFDGSLDFKSRAAEYSVDAAAIGLQGTGKVHTVVAGGVLYLSLDALRGVKGDVKRVGSDKVRGTRATHYRVTIDADQAVNSAPEGQRDEVRNSIGALGSKTIPADVWVDGKGRLRKVRLHVAASSTTTKGLVAFEFFDLGARVNVEAPPANEVVDFQDLLGGSPSTTGPSGAAGG